MKMRGMHYLKANRIRIHCRGFSLIEIMLVLAIISVLVGLSIKTLTGNLDEAKYVAATADISSISTQLKSYEMMALTLPSTDQGLKALVDRPTSEPVPKRWRQLLDEVPKDPWNTPYQYRYPGKKNVGKFDVFSLGPDKVESEDDIGNWKTEGLKQ